MRENFESTRKNFGHAKYPQKNFRPTKYAREKIVDQRNMNEKKFWTHKIS